jgi:hypothetical protein
MTRNIICNFIGLLFYTFMNELKLSYASIRYEEPIVYITFKQGSELGFPEMKELVQYAEALSGHKNYFVFSNVGDDVSVTREGRRFAFDAGNSPYQRGTAVFVKNNMVSYAANLYVGFNRPLFPYKVFTEKQKAIDWLLSLPLQTESETG